MEQLTKDLPEVAVYLDDVLVGDTDAKEHLNNLRHLLQRLSDTELTCRLEMCKLAEPCVEYLGHLLSKERIAKGPKVDAVKRIPIF